MPAILPQRTLAYAVHFYTAFGAVLGLIALEAITRGDYLQAFWLMAAAVLIDSSDGFFARRAEVSKYAANIDGALLDNIVDYLNYVIVPAFLFIQSELLPPVVRTLLAAAIVLSSGYQFSQVNAKSSDHFFIGFPCYWNIVGLYLFLWQLSPWLNAGIVALLVVLVFLPIKYIYPSRMNADTGSAMLRSLLLGGAVVWGLVTIAQLWYWPESSGILTAISFCYIALYLGVSLSKTLEQK